MFRCFFVLTFFQAGVIFVKYVTTFRIKFFSNLRNVIEENLKAKKVTKKNLTFVDI